MKNKFNCFACKINIICGKYYKKDTLTVMLKKLKFFEG